MKNRDSLSTIPASENQDQEMESTIKNEKILDNSFIKVIFKQEHFFKKYKSKIEQFFKELLEEGELEDGELAIEHIQVFQKSDHSFLLDVQDASNPDEIPIYSTSYEDVLNHPDTEVKEKNEDVNKPQAMTCFNCLGDHHLKDCSERMDRQRINANKKKLLVSNNSSRYHVEEKKNAIAPGNPSANLRDALGLKDDQLPRYIYSMRVIGYPPGWMKEAVHETSGLSLYDDSLDQSSSERNSFKMANEETLFDTEKFVTFPGFNSPVPDGVRDEWHKVGWCPIQPHQQLSETLKQSNTMNSKNLYKRKYLPSTSIEETKKTKSGTNDSNESNNWSPPSSSTPDKCTKSDSHLDDKNCATPISLKRLSSLSKSPGTPIIGQGNTCLKLPSADKFAQDITEHLPFENLPDAVGKYENMRNVLSNVQKKLKDIKDKMDSDAEKGN